MQISFSLPYVQVVTTMLDYEAVVLKLLSH